MNRIAVIADIHGNLPALQAAVEDITRRGVDVVVNLGDHASGPLWPHETISFLMQQSWLQIAGNCNRQLLQLAPADHGAFDRFGSEGEQRCSHDTLTGVRAPKMTSTFRRRKPAQVPMLRIESRGFTSQDLLRLR